LKPVVAQREKQEGQGTGPEPSVILVRTRNEQSIVLHLIDEPYAPSQRIIEQTGIDEGTFYNSLKKLRQRKVVRIAGKIIHHTGGRPAKIWALNHDAIGRGGLAAWPTRGRETPEKDGR